MMLNYPTHDRDEHTYSVSKVTPSVCLNSSFCSDMESLLRANR